MTGPLTLEQWLARLGRKFGLKCRLRGDRVSARKFDRLPQDEQQRVLASVHQVHALLVRRVERRAARKSQEQQQRRDAMEPQPGRRVVGMQVVAGYPGLSKLVYADEVKDIRPSPRARQPVGLPYGWSK